jgi:hypothetical protein
MYPGAQRPQEVEAKGTLISLIMRMIIIIIIKIIIII